MCNFLAHPVLIMFAADNLYFQVDYQSGKIQYSDNNNTKMPGRETY